jgi:hypothetical protein
MKPGDKVWIFHEEEIQQWIYEETPAGTSVLVDPNGMECSLNGEFVPFFSTRDELCEHYRKIFE